LVVAAIAVAVLMIACAMGRDHPRRYSPSRHLIEVADEALTQGLAEGFAQEPTQPTHLGFWESDGGRAQAGFRGKTNDCAVRAIAIATRTPYKEVYNALKDATNNLPRKGVPRSVYDAYLTARGWVWTPTMTIGSGCTVHMRKDELPEGRLIVRLSGHLSAVVWGVVHDTEDPSRGGSRCVYGYYKEGLGYK
jgi:hypothetical protein